MWYAVLVSSDLSLNKTEGALPRVIAHNLRQEDAERMERELTTNTVEGHPTGVSVFLLAYDLLHGSANPQGCVGCDEVVLVHLREVLRIAEAEAAKRGKKILDSLDSTTDTPPPKPPEKCD
jgi:hypothetical protein